MSVAIFQEPPNQMQVLIGVYLIYFVTLTSARPYRFHRHTLTDTIFTFGKLSVVYMSCSFLEGDASDGLPVLFLVFCVYVLFALIFLSGVYFFFKGKAADPQYDAMILCNIRDKLVKGILPRQHNFLELVPGLDSNSARWSHSKEQQSSGNSQESLNALVVDLESKCTIWKEKLDRKNDLAEKDCALISDKICPSKLVLCFRNLVESQEKVVQNYTTEDKGDLSEHMNNQSKYLKELLAPTND